MTETTGETPTPPKSKWLFNKKWTDIDIERVRVHWAAGRSAGWIANDFDRPGLSRLAVIGIIFRHKFKSPMSRDAEKPKPALRKRLSGGARRALAKAKSRVNGLAADSVLANVVRVRPELPPPSEVATKAFGKPCSLVDLTATSCRWPIGDPREASFAFCNAQAGAGEPYCPAHAHAARGPAAYRY